MVNVANRGGDPAELHAHQFSKKAKLYKLKEGHSHNGFDEDGERKVFGPGDKVMLEPDQYAAFDDKFEPVSKKEAQEAAEDPNPEVTPEQPQQDPNKTTPPGAPKAAETKPSDSAKGAGASANAASKQTIA